MNFMQALIGLRPSYSQAEQREINDVLAQKIMHCCSVTKFFCFGSISVLMEQTVALLWCRLHCDNTGTGEQRLLKADKLDSRVARYIEGIVTL